MGILISDYSFLLYTSIDPVNEVLRAAAGTFCHSMSLSPDSLEINIFHTFICLKRQGEIRLNGQGGISLSIAVISVVVAP